LPKKKHGLSLLYAYLLLNVYGDRNPDLSLAAHARQFPLLSEVISKFSASNATELNSTKPVSNKDFQSSWIRQKNLNTSQ
jgi:hypothetical protein